MKKFQKGFTATELVIVAYVIVIIAGIIGWVMNIATIVHSDFAVMSGMLIARCIGVFVAPLGAVLGYL